MQLFIYTQFTIPLVMLLMGKGICMKYLLQYYVQ